MSAARKITRENYQIIKRYAETHTQDESVRRFNISSATVSSIKKEPDFDSYINLLKSYAQNNYTKRHRSSAQNLREDGPFGKYANPVHKPQELSSPFSDLVNKPFDINKDQPTAKSKRSCKKHRSDYVKKLDNEQFAKALELAPTGLNRTEIAEKIGLSYSQFSQRIHRSKTQTERFDEEFEKGKSIRNTKRRAWLVSGLVAKGCKSAPIASRKKSEEPAKTAPVVKTVVCTEPICKKKETDLDLLSTKGLVFLEKAFGVALVIIALAVAAKIVAETVIK